MGTNCAPFVADLLLYCYEGDFMLSLSTEHQDDIVTVFNNTSMYLDDLLDNNHFPSMVNKISPSALQLNKANTSDKQANFLDINFSIKNGYVTTKIHDKRDYFNFNIVNFPFLDGDVSRATSYRVYISQLVRFSRACNDVNNFNKRNLCITEKLLKQGCRYHKLRKTFWKFDR
jgi:hypothetical protein